MDGVLYCGIVCLPYVCAGDAIRVVWHVEEQLSSVVWCFMIGVVDVVVDWVDEAFARCLKVLVEYGSCVSSF